MDLDIINRIAAYLGWCIILCLITLTCEAQSAQLHEVTVNSDNDAYLFINQDQYYTNGIAFSYRKLRNTKYLRRNEVKEVWALSLGHKLYNAYNGYSELQFMDRPFTAYLYVRGTNTKFYKNESALSFSAEVGVYGKWAFGEQMQRGFHHLFGFYQINGWEYQLKDNATLDMRMAYSRLLARSASGKTDLQATSRVSVGLNQSYIGVGPILRLGKTNALYETAFYNNRLSSGAKVPKKERYFYYWPMVFYRLYDASIQGGMLLHDKGPVIFGIEPWVISQLLGFTYAHNQFSIDAHLQFNTKEVKSTATAHQYGSITLGYSF
ncbi:lipid A deacylase LpxR family protein [Olivibacter ginsenosidimutans]|uniref:Lipid A deacylase LpxR family protein n=1 Tax=Olivibacter ginsenosidimutans TaxID=1176537 RepID=A0ABP9BCW7_9SPHI